MENDTDRTESDLGKLSNFHNFHQASAKHRPPRRPGLSNSLLPS